MLSNKTRGNVGRGHTAQCHIFQGQDGISQLVIHITSFSRVLFLPLCCFHRSIVVAITIIASIIKTLVSQPRNFLTSTLPIHFPHPAAAEKSRSACVVLSCWLRLNHDTAISDSSIYFFSHSKNQQPALVQTYPLLLIC